MAEIPSLANEIIKASNGTVSVFEKSGDSILFQTTINGEGPTFEQASDFTRKLDLCLSERYPGLYETKTIPNDVQHITGYKTHVKRVK